MLVPHLQLTFPPADDWANPDRVQYGTKSGIGAASTFNHLTDALLDVEATRLMYFRRLRTLADKYYAQGKLRQVCTRVSTVGREGQPLRDNLVWWGSCATASQRLAPFAVPHSKAPLHVDVPARILLLRAGYWQCCTVSSTAENDSAG